ncbi:DUF222 domain-containing protein [Microtetraspora malaysiensis]|uniref:HNH endonuclease signature motif containing protein n=1 Tax=Microtetraspora malaysiensis TaxID=161358 RepID=UPI003D8C7B43
MDGFDAVIVLQAYARLEAHVQARKATVTAEVGLYEISVSGMEKMPEPDKNSPDEIRAALRLTRRAAEREYGIAYDLKVRLPMVRDALEAGTIDKTRAVVFCDWLEDIPIELARAVAGHLLPNAGRWTTSELREKIKKLLIAADPGWARRRYERAVHQRRVVGVRHADGSATITGQQLPVDQAAAAIARVDAIAIRAKRAGLHAPIDHIRADVFLGLLDGSMSGLDDDGVIAVLFGAAARAKAGEEEDYDDQLSDDPSTGSPEDSGPLDGGETGHTSTPDDPSEPDDPSTPDDPSEPDDTHQPQATSQPQVREGQGGCGPLSSDAVSVRVRPPARALPIAPLPAPADAAAAGRTAAESARSDAETDGRAGARGGGKARAASDGGHGVFLGYAAGELRVRASTLMHLDDLPAELAGWGPVHAHLARIVAKRQIGGEWRFAVCDEDGHLLFAGVTRRRPGGWPRHAAINHAQEMGVAGGPEQDVRAVPVRGRGIVELQFPLSLLRALHADLHALGGWAGVVADAVGQYEAAGADHAPGEGEGEGDGADAGRGAGAGGVHGVRSSGGAYSAPAGAVPQEAAPHDGASDRDGGDGRRRFPRAGLRRHIQVRDRVCTHPGCRAPATRSELDHTHPYAAGGFTSEGNLAAACAHDHDLRDNGWQVVQTAPGHVTWISRTGHRYPAQPSPVIEPLPEPFAPAGWAHLRPADSGYGAGSITDPAVDELPYVPAYRYEPAWWEEPLAKPDTAQEGTVRAGPPADPAGDIPPL